MERTYHYYLIIHRANGPGAVGPFKDEQERNDFACALWFGLPARMPYAERGERVPFDNKNEQLYYTAVDLGNARLMSFRNVTVGDLSKGKSFPRDKEKKRKPVVGMSIAFALMLLSSATLLHAQTLTNADLGKKLHAAPAPPEVYAMLKQHEYKAPASCVRCDGPYIASTNAKTPYAGPWDWPAERPARRLDGTLVDSPPQIYGALPWYRGWRSHSEFPRAARPERRR